MQIPAVIFIIFTTAQLCHIQLWFIQDYSKGVKMFQFLFVLNEDFQFDLTLGRVTGFYQRKGANMFWDNSILVLQDAQAFFIAEVVNKKIYTWLI